MGAQFYMRLPENAPLTGTKEGSAGDLLAKLHVLGEKKKKKRQLVNGLSALPEERYQQSRIVPPFFVKWYFAAVSAL